MKATSVRAALATLLTVLATIGLGTVRSPALGVYKTPGRLSAVIHCWVIAPTSLSGNRWVLRIGSNHPDSHRVHSFRVTWNNGLIVSLPFTRTYIPTGPKRRGPRGGLA